MRPSLYQPLFIRLELIEKFIKAQVKYINVDNDWILLRFFLCENKVLIYDLHVNGLKFVIDKWFPFFDLYSTIIGRVDQWIRVPRLPWEF